MAKLLKLRFLDRSVESNDKYIEVYCDPDNKRGYFRRLNKDQLDVEGTTIRPTLKKFYEARLMGSTWRELDKKKFMTHLDIINKERVARGWPEVVPFEPVDDKK